MESLSEAITGGWFLLGLPDSQLEGFALGLSHRMPGQPEFAFHLSGSVEALVLDALGCPWCSVHPLRPFADPERSSRLFAGTCCVGEGQPGPLQALLPAFEAIGGRVFTANLSSKRLYHAATVTAANYLVTLRDLAEALAVAAGLEPKVARELLGKLQRIGLDELEISTPALALTGPIERGDVDALRALLESVQAAVPERFELFVTLARATLALARARRPDRDCWIEMEQVLDRPFS